MDKKQEATAIEDAKIESNLCQCRRCGAIKLRVQQGMFNAKDKRWIDSEGMQWVGRVCYNCKKHEAAVRARAKAKKK